jgi:hypothetical protein
MGRKQLPEDFREFIHLLNRNKVRYLLVGGWAVGFYGNPRATKDIDFYIAVDDSNLERILKTLSDFGAPPCESALFREPGNIFRMGRSPIQIEIINHADGLDFEKAYENRNVIIIDSLEIHLVSKEDLIKNKQASGRLRDLADIESLK